MKALPFFLFASLLATSVHAADATHRPKIGLVLGGGGALGWAHIGVLKVLEENHIPIDFVVGTSAGSIIGGLYASGMSPDEIEQYLASLDWNEVMNDATPRRELFFRRKRDDQRYLFEMGLNWGGPKMGTGMAAGQKFNNVMEFVTLRSVAITNFDELPIPFRAVATDLQSGTPHVMNSGDLATAMRASMAVPGAFTAVERDGRILVDGGIVDNLPVDVAKAMGADIVIAVDVGSDADKVSPEDLKSLGGILGRTYTIAQRPGQMAQFKRADIGIQPVLAGFTASQFDRVSELVPKGEEAARAKLPELARLAVSPEAYSNYLAQQRHANPTSILISTVKVIGNERVSEDIIRGRIRSRPNEPFDTKRVSGDLMRVYGIGEFEQVVFRLQPNPDGSSTLEYHVKEKGWGPGYFKYGLNLQSDFKNDAQWAMLLNLTRMSINSLGAEWRNEIELGSKKNVVSEFYQPLDTRGFLFLAPNAEYKSRTQALYQNDKHIADYKVTKMEGRLDLGVQLRSYAEIRAGPMWGNGKAEVDTGSSDLPNFDDNYAGWNTSLTVDRKDRTLFAREGYYFAVNGQFYRESMGGNVEADKVSGQLGDWVSLGDHTLALNLQGGSSLGTELPGYAQFTLGGPFSFAGLAEDEFRGSYLGVGSITYRYRLLQLPSQLGRGVYTLTRFDVGNVWDDKVDTGDLRTGVAVGLGADSAIGPMFLAYGMADGGYSRLYFSLGTTF